MKKLRLKLARALIETGFWLIRLAERLIPKQNLAVAKAAREELYARKVGRVIEADGPEPKWKPDQKGGVIMQEPDLVRAEREMNETL